MTGLDWPYGTGAAARAEERVEERAEERAEQRAAARVLVFSQRNVAQHLFHAPQYEMEDVIGEIDDARIFAPMPRVVGPAEDLGWRAVDLTRHWLRRLPRPPIAHVDVTLDGEYDLFFGVFHFPYQLAYLDNMRGWRERCRKAVAFIIEFWSPEFQPYSRYVEMLSQFDHVFVFNSPVLAPITRLSGCPASYLAAGVDALRFSPYPVPDERVIDVLAYGRRSPDAHRQLAAMAERREIFYVHDTVRLSPTLDYRQHRAMLSSYARRSRYAMAYRINEDRLVRTRGEEGLTTRLFEITAAGAVMLGSRPNCGEFAQYFDWPDALIEVPWTEPDMAAVLADLDAQPERIASIRRANAVQALRRHDWAYRWGQVLEVAGLPPLPAFHERVARLRALAAEAERAYRPARVGR